MNTSLSIPKLTDHEINDRLLRSEHVILCTLKGLDELAVDVPCFELCVLGELPVERLN